MQHEFNNRVTAQRAILRVVNRYPWRGEQLFGLSSKTIDRWVLVNRIEPHLRLVQLVREASAKLFFLANKSQEQVTDEYAEVRDQITTICGTIRRELDAGVIEVT